MGGQSIRHAELVKAVEVKDGRTRAMTPAYLSFAEADWQERIEAAWELLRNPCPSGQPVRQAGRRACHVCPRYCKVDRTDRDSPRVGFCRVKDRAVVFSFHAHHGEENPLRGWRGSGTIFFSSCNLSCLFCQNWEIPRPARAAPSARRSWR